MQLEQAKRHQSSKAGEQDDNADTQGFVSNVFLVDFNAIGFDCHESSPSLPFGSLFYFKICVSANDVCVSPHCAEAFSFLAFFFNRHSCGFSCSCRFVVRQRDAVLPSRASDDSRVADANGAIDPGEKLRFRPLRSHKVPYCCHHALPFPVS